MACTTGEEDVRVWGPIDNKRVTRPSDAQCTCVPQRTAWTLTRIPGDRASPGHPCGLAQAPLPGPAYFLAKMPGALCPHFWAAKFGKPVEENFLPLEYVTPSQKGRGVIKDQLSCTHFLCQETPPLIHSVLAWALRLGAYQSSVPDSNPALLLVLLLFPFLISLRLDSSSKSLWVTCGLTKSAVFALVWSNSFAAVVILNAP